MNEDLQWWTKELQWWTAGRVHSVMYMWCMVNRMVFFFSWAEPMYWNNGAWWCERSFVVSSRTFSGCWKALVVYRKKNKIASKELMNWIPRVENPPVLMTLLERNSCPEHKNWLWVQEPFLVSSWIGLLAPRTPLLTSWNLIITFGIYSVAPRSLLMTQKTLTMILRALIFFSQEPWSLCW